MAYIEFEKSVRAAEWSMHRLHSHAHYEIYFLSQGSRSFYLANALLTLNAPAVLVIPPHVMHKTEGGICASIQIVLCALDKLSELCYNDNTERE